MTPTLSQLDRSALGLGGLALLVYVPAIGWGLPAVTGGDVIRGWDVDGISGIGPLAEFFNLLVGPTPDWYVVYPLFHYLLLGICYAPYLAWLWMSGGLASPSSVYPFGFDDPGGSIATLALIGRVLTLAMAVGCVLAVYRAATIVWDRRTGLVAGFIAMLSGPMVYRARTGNLDVPVLFWTALGIVVLAKVATQGLTVRRAVWLGAFAALATATKDQAYGGWVTALLAVSALHWYGRLPGPSLRDTARWKAPLAVVVSGIVVYAVAGGIVVWPDRFIAHMNFILTYEEARFAFEELSLRHGRDPIGLVLLLRDVIWVSVLAMGPPAAAAAMVGVFAKSRGDTFVVLLLSMSVGYFALVMVLIAHMQFRYAVLPVVLLAFPAAHALAVGWRAAGWRRVLSASTMVLGTVWLLAGAGNLTYQMYFDARYDAADWLADHVEPGQRIGFFGDKGQLPGVPAGVAVEQLSGGASSATSLAAAEVDVLLVIPDYSSPPDTEHSLFLARPAWQGLRDGVFPYGLAASFETPPPWGLRYPFVNPTVRVFLRER